MLPPDYWNSHPAGFTLEKSDRGTEVKTGPVAQKMNRAMLDTIETLARTGNNLIVDDVILSEDYLNSCLETLKNFRHLLVKVHCPLEIAEQRERERGDRETGFAKFQYNLVQAIEGYDFVVDTAAFGPHECALQIKERLELGWSGQG